jgi:putative flavoprotein involved in K+ transport
METERYETVIVGAGQAGLHAAYHLRRAGRSFTILEARARVGDVWRERYDSLRLFTPAWAIGLPGFPYRAKGSRQPTKDELADHLEAFVTRFELPVRTGVRVDGVERIGDRYLVRAGGRAIEAENVVVASGAHTDPVIPAFARDLDPGIVQLHSSRYRNPTQLREGGVLVVGAGNSGADIALEAARTHRTWISGPDRGHIPPDIDTWVARNIAFHVVRFVGVHVLTLRTPIGRRKIEKMRSQGDILVRVKPKQLVAAGIERLPKTVGAQSGVPLLEDGRVLTDVTNVIWAVGFRLDLSWIDLPIFGEDGAPRHERGVVTSEPGLYFLGLPFQFAVGSDTLPGVGRDVRYVVKHLLRRSTGIPAALSTAA